jgi:hypothetical protein
VTQEMKTGFEKAKRIVGQWPRLPKAVAVPPLSWITQTYNVEQKTGMPKGGHFAALEQPDLLVADIGKVFAKIDQKQAKNAPDTNCMRGRLPLSLVLVPMSARNLQMGTARASSLRRPICIRPSA